MMPQVLELDGNPVITGNIFIVSGDTLDACITMGAETKTKITFNQFYGNFDNRNLRDKLRLMWALFGFVMLRRRMP